MNRIANGSLSGDIDEGNTRIADKSAEGTLNSGFGTTELAIKEELIEELRNKRREVILKDPNMTCDVM